MYRVFSKDNCVYCTKAKHLLSSLNLPFEEHKLSPTFTPDKMFEMIGKQVRSMPQIMFGDKLIGFYELDVVANIIAIVNQIGSQGLVGLVALWILYWVFTKK